ncbi:hypothetical protein CHRY9390_03288 [Chryseobacterium aquaeductus]|uniref:Uncharacterized protein n=1 Tax=Chryseobacterium aquaeductus TaxID=2675056 RepID=A0A9N8MDL6_9FLAO|nr:hypothetical protein [Chryseobacterium aquaeductus]CAA7329884.1 hypothetical protein CHRY9390_00532 [Chryseobacterium potabilaquae]CAA7332535.1 hypothetical protein CHRY9390_03258 [Chryseobacterium potabilaquae]CAA7332546.1 hypothetical protein CHRY9390_03269 [Chryseobacterium potabilaquae]CAA7332565.1 hypothetical protein CHRY9390_03288 [Chryseobacterium potabilaquae]CAD7799759.1 hypothetical protein CHRY9390_00532 [Chryseobacterium aquaeductus]
MKNLILPFLLILTLLFSCRSEDYGLLENKANSYDVYVAGRENNMACYWKNGNKVNLLYGNEIYIEKFLVDNNNIYAFGEALNILDKFTFWKNNIKYDVLQYLGIPSGVYFRVFDFYVDNDNIYFLGLVENPFPITSSQKYQLCYWKNGTKVILNTSGSDNFATNWQEMIVYNNDLYISVKQDNTLGYYKNNIYTQITNQGYSTGIAKNSNGVYIPVVNNVTSSRYYLNLITGQTINSNFDHKLFIDNNDFYSLSGYNEYVKNGNIIQINNNEDYNNPWDLKVINQNEFMIRMKISQGSVFGIEYKVFINNVETQHIIQEMSGIQYNNSFNSIFVVQN